MRPIKEIPPAIQGRYRELQHDLLTKVSKLPARIHVSHPVFVDLLSKTMTEMSMHFQKSIIILLKKMENKNSVTNDVDILQEIQDHFSIWSTWLSSFKNNIIEEINLKICKESSGKMTKNLLNTYQERLAEIDAIVIQTQLSITALVKNTDNPSINTSKEIQKFNKLLEISFNQTNLISLFKSMQRLANLLKIAPLIEVERNPLEFDVDDFYEGPIKEYPLQKSDSDTEFSLTEPNSSTSSSESDTESQMSNQSIDSDSDIEIRGNTPPNISPNRARVKQTPTPPLLRGHSLDSAPVLGTKNNPSTISPNRARIAHTAPLVRGRSVDDYSPPPPRSIGDSQQIQTSHENLKISKERIDDSIRKIAENKSTGNLLGIQRLTAAVVNLANTDELKKYAADRTTHWEKKYSTQPLISPRKAS